MLPVRFGIPAVQMYGDLDFLLKDSLNGVEDAESQSERFIEAR